jgi:hypothetical protein
MKPALANSSASPYLKKSFRKIGLVEWLKVKAPSSSPSTTKKKKKQRNCLGNLVYWCTSIIPEFRRLRKEDLESEVSLGYPVETVSKNK